MARGNAPNTNIMLSMTTQDCKDDAAWFADVTSVPLSYLLLLSRNWNSNKLPHIRPSAEWETLPAIDDNDSTHRWLLFAAGADRWHLCCDSLSNNHIQSNPGRRPWRPIWLRLKVKFCRFTNQTSNGSRYRGKIVPKPVRFREQTQRSASEDSAGARGFYARHMLMLCKLRLLMYTSWESGAIIPLVNIRTQTHKQSILYDSKR